MSKSKAVKRKKHWAEKTLEFVAELSLDIKNRYELEYGLTQLYESGEITLRDAYEINNAFYMGAAFVNGSRQIYIFDRDAADIIGNTEGLPDLRSVIEHAPYKDFVVDLGNGNGFYFYIDKSMGYKDWKALGENDVFLEDRLTGFTSSDGQEMAFTWFPIPHKEQMLKPQLDLDCGKPFHDRLNSPDRPGSMSTVYVENIVAYLCSENAEISKSVTPCDTRKLRSQKKQRKLTQSTWYNVGTRIGAKFRAYSYMKSSGGKSGKGSVRPHIRRAHWHHYWTGKRDGERHLILRWIEPTIVAGESLQDIESTAHHLNKPYKDGDL